MGRLAQWLSYIDCGGEIYCTCVVIFYFLFNSNKRKQQKQQIIEIVVVKTFSTSFDQSDKCVAVELLDECSQRYAHAQCI